MRIALPILGLTIFVAGCTAHAQTSQKQLVTRNGSAMGTEVRFSVWTDDEPRALAAMDQGFDEIKRLEALMTTWKPESEVSQINANAGIKPVHVSPETMEVLLKSRWASEISNGAFDVTFYAMKGLWKFDEDLEKKVPPKEEIKKRLALIDWKKLILDEKESTAFLQKPGMAINLGGIAKGYAVDRAVAILRKAGFPDAIVQAGGDLMCAGSKSGAAWKAGVRDPRGGRDDYFAVMELIDHSFSTAGDYERFFFLDGKRYHHIIDTKTGQPANRSRSVTLYAKNAFTADALDDAVFIMGWKKGMEMIDKLDDVGAVVVDNEGEVHISKQIAARVHVVHPPKNAP
jgi:thiamine biosynthesis lipoprotein